MKLKINLENNIWFTSDWHLGEDRFDIMFRPFESFFDNDETILGNFRNKFKDGDTLIHLGDVIYKIRNNVNYEDYGVVFDLIRKRYPNSKFILINGNYDLDDENKQPLLDKLFDVRKNQMVLQYPNAPELYLNHYPKNVNIQELFGVTGHIHSLWKVQPNMINVGVDAWNYMPVSIDQLMFTINAIENHYDDNVFLK